MQFLASMAILAPAADASGERGIRRDTMQPLSQAPS